MQKPFCKEEQCGVDSSNQGSSGRDVKRAAYQGGHVWGQVLPAPELPPATSWGWTKSDEGLYEPHWTRLPQAAKLAVNCYHVNARRVV